MVRVLITGINGFVGCHLSQLLAEKGYDVFGTRIEDTNLDVVSRNVPDENILMCDLRDRDQVADAVEKTMPEIVFHLAGQSHVPASWKDPAMTFEVNLIGSINLFESVLKTVPESMCVFISSGDFYDVTSAAADEDAPVRPRNPYALSKMAADFMAAQYFQARNLQVIRLRPFNHIGPYQSERFVVSEFARQIALAECGFADPLLRVGNLDVERDFTDVRDMVRAYELTPRKCEAGECYNISSQKAYSIKMILDILLADSSVEIRVERDPAKYRPVEIARFAGDSGKFRSATGWSPEIPIEKTVIDVLDYWRERVKDG